MGFFSNLFGSSDERKAIRIIKRVKDKAREELKPLANLGRAIVKASQDCATEMAPVLDVPDEKEKKEAEVLVFYEFLYFFMHLTNRSAFTQLTEQQLNKLQAHLGPLLSSVAVDSFFAHWPEGLKAKMQEEFYEKLNDAEIEYSTCKKMLSDDFIDSDALFSKLALNVAELTGNSLNPAVVVLVISCGVNAYKELQLDELVKNAGKVLQ